jgi:hypothetical protein
MLSSCKYIVSLIVLLLLTGSGSAAFAYDWVVTAKVTMVEPTYVPSYVDFMVDGSAGNCFVLDNSGADEPTKIANANAAFSALMTAAITGREITLFGTNAPNGGNCYVQFMHF